MSRNVPWMAAVLLALVSLAIGVVLGPKLMAPPHDHATDEVGLYTCGMHPNVVQEGPGSCPICGMDLTPMKASTTASGERKIAYWQAPMDPSYIRDAPGKSPMGMDLVPVYEDQTASSHIVEINPGIVQQIGVETMPVERTTVFRHLRTLGEVEVGEDELSVVNLRFSGWVERLRVERTGDEVKAGEVLFEIYSPELVGAQEDWLLARRAQGDDAPLTVSSRRRLELWAISARDLDRVAKAGVASRTLPIRAPRSGFVLHKNVVQGARIKAGEDLYRIGNLQRIWVKAEVYEHDAPWIEEDQPAQLELTNLPGQVLEGKVSYIYPTLNARSRTLSLRLEFDNPGVKLKPGMFATVYIQYRRRDDVLAVPGEAILRAGRRELVFVALGQGRFEPREIVTGIVGDRRLTEVVEGLNEGEQIVVASQFLIDSESQLQEALRRMLAGSAGAELPVVPPGTVWACPMHPEDYSDEPGRCSQCGMDLVERPGTEVELLSLVPAYVCPMHPDETSDEPGRCGICNMFLEANPAAAGHDEHEHTP